jgi:transposase InsO family protein
MERFWGNIKTSHQGLCDANLIERTIFEYHQHRIHSAFDWTPAQAWDQRNYRGH